MCGYTEIALLQYELEKLRAELAKKDAKIEWLKTVPMMYRRMAFNAQLQDENNELRQRVTEKDEVIAEAGEMLAMRDRQLAALKGENESLKRDAARLDWVEHQDFYDLSFAVLVDQPNDGMIAVSISEGWHLGNNLREAIDAAMIAGEK